MRPVIATRRDLAGALPGLRRTLSHIRPHLRRERFLVAGGFAALFAEVVFRLLEPWPLKVVVDAVIEPGASERPDMERLLVFAGLAVVAAVALRALMSYLTTVAFALAGNRVLTRVRADLFDHVQRLSVVQHSQQRVGDLVTRLTGDVGRLQEVAVTAGLPLLGNVVTLVGMTAVMAWIDLRLTLVVMIAFPLFLVTGRARAKKINAVSRDQRAREGELAAVAVETLGAMRVVQAYSLEPRLAGRFDRSNQASLRQGVAARRLAAGLERRTDVLVGAATAVVLVVGGRRVLAGAMSPGDLVVFVTYLKSAFKPLRDLAKYTGRIARAAASGERIVDLLETEPDIRDSPNARHAPAFRGDVRFEGVVAGYGDDRPALDALDLVVSRGERIGVVGPSGSGKSTMVSLLLRVLDPRRGTVRIDGFDLRCLQVSTVRAQIAIVLQESVLFAVSIRDNIADGRPGATDEQIVAAARLANADEFIRALPEGYDTVVGERGATLSGGQRQRIAIARAALRDAAIVVLDEATAGLDRDNADEVIGALERLTAGRTTFVIAHDLEAVRHLARVVRIEDGRVVGDGPPVAVVTTTTAVESGARTPAGRPRPAPSPVDGHAR